jgi:hypothetical protein
MRLLVVGKLNGQLATAVKMAMATGAKVSHVETVAAATHALRAGQGADLLMVDYELDIAGLIAANEAERITVPVVACGVGLQVLADLEQGEQLVFTVGPALVHARDLVLQGLEFLGVHDRAVVHALLFGLLLLGHGVDLVLEARLVASDLVETKTDLAEAVVGRIGVGPHRGQLAAVFQHPSACHQATERRVGFLKVEQASGRHGRRRLADDRR